MVSQRIGASKLEDAMEYNIYNDQEKGTKTFSKNICGWSCRLLTYKELPDWLVDNEYLRAHFRPPLNSYWECTKSMFRLHTETCNIWSHAIGVFLFLGLMVQHALTDESSAYEKFTSTFAVYYTGIIACMAMSAGFHTLSCHSPEVAGRWVKMDYAGIILLLWGSFWPWLHYSYYCYQLLRNNYMYMITIFGGLTLVVTQRKEFEQARTLRVVVFTLLGLTAVIPTVHFFLLDGFWETMEQKGHIVLWLILSLALYASGAIVYGNRIPERYSPGAFDIWGHSHQIMHVLVLLGVISNYYGARTFSTERLAGKLPC